MPPHVHFFFFNDTATTEIYTLSPTRRSSDLASPSAASTCPGAGSGRIRRRSTGSTSSPTIRTRCRDRKSTRLNSSHANISYAVFCLKKKEALACPVESHLRVVPDDHSILGLP